MDKSRLDRILNDFYLISGMETSVLNAYFHTVAFCRGGRNALCGFLHRSDGVAEICKASDLSHLEEVARTAKPVMYVCPFGMLEAIVPVIRDERIIAYIISAMGIVSGTEREAEEMTCSLVSSVDRDCLSGMIDGCATLTKERADAYFNMLIMIAEHIANDESLTDGEESIGTLVKYYVKNNLSHKLTLNDIALHLHCSTVTLTEHFKAEFGITIMEYVTSKRMNLAEKLLLTTDSPIREISATVGFADVEYFSRTFKRFHGESPATWRAGAKSK